jgi:hypothetical protein
MLLNKILNVAEQILNATVITLLNAEQILNVILNGAEQILNVILNVAEQILNATVITVLNAIKQKY